MEQIAGGVGPKTKQYARQTKTVMIAALSPANYNYEETMSTIKYASRARNIKNKPIINRDANSMLIEALRNQITSLQTEVGEY